MRTLGFSALLLPLLGAEPGFVGVSVEPGTTVTKTFVNSLELELVDVSLSEDGDEQELPPGFKPEVQIVDEERVVLVDRYASVEDGRATELVRTFETLEDSSTHSVVRAGSDPVEQERVGESALLGVSVRFTWDDGTYQSEVVGDDVDEGLLKGLEGDADFLFLLSDKPMEEGSTWEVDPMALDRLSNPSGNLKIYAPDADLRTNDEFANGFRDGLEGEIQATVESLDDDECVISFVGEVTTSFDVAAAEMEGLEQTMEFAFEVAGKLVWDLERGFARELEWGGDATMVVTMVEELDARTMEHVQTFEGTFESAATFE